MRDDFAPIILPFHMQFSFELVIAIWYNTWALRESIVSFTIEIELFNHSFQILQQNVLDIHWMSLNVSLKMDHFEMDDWIVQSDSVINERT